MCIIAISFYNNFKQFSPSRNQQSWPFITIQHLKCEYEVYKLKYMNFIADNECLYIYACKLLIDCLSDGISKSYANKLIGSNFRITTRLATVRSDNMVVRYHLQPHLYI